MANRPSYRIKKSTHSNTAPGAIAALLPQVEMGIGQIKTKSMGLLLVLAVAASSLQGQPQSRTRRADRAPSRNSSDRNPCAIKELKKSDVQGAKVYSPDGRQFLINKEDQGGVAQNYLGQDGSSDLSCITCAELPNGPKRKRLKLQPNWHPSGKWIFMGVEREKYSPPPLLGLSRKYVEGMLRCGLWTNMYAVLPDGRQWHRLTDFKSGVKGTPDGFTGPAFTPDGKRAVWSQFADGNIFAYWPFGRWELILADFEEKNGVPTFINHTNITPKGMYWNEPANFHPDNESLLFSGSDLKDAQGMDLYTLNIRIGTLTNLTKSPTVWDEHGIFSPDGEKIVFMSSHPYRSDPKFSKVLTLKTEFMLMDKDGSNLTQLTHFSQPGYPEYGVGVAASPQWNPDGRSVNLRRLLFPKYEDWELTFEGACGNNRLR